MTTSEQETAIARRPKYMELRELIRQQILSGQLPAGSAILTEPEMARRHGVSISTVKEALKDLVKDGLITRVRGRGTFVNADLRQSQTILPLLTPVLGNGLTREFYLGYEERSVSLGLSTVLWSTRQILEGQSDDWSRHPLMKDIKALAIIAAGSGREAHEQDLRVIRSLLDAGKKVVVVDQYLTDLTGDKTNVIFLGAQNLPPMHELGRHLIETGRKRLGFVGLADAWYTQQQRLAGLSLAAAEHLGKVRLHDPLLLDKSVMDLHSRNYESLPRAVRENIVAYAHQCDAVCAANDLIAALVVRVLRESRIDVPEECAVTGFDDSEIASATTPPLTSVRQPFHRMGACAVDLLLALRAGTISGPARWLVDSTVVLRESSRPASSRAEGKGH